MSKIDRMLQRAISFIEIGRLKDAQSLLKAIIYEEPYHQLAWGWYVHSFEDKVERIRAFDEYLRIFPEDQTAQDLQNKLIIQQYRQGKKTSFERVEKFEQKRGQGGERSHSLASSKLALRGIFILLICMLGIANIFIRNRAAQLVDQNTALSQQYTNLDQLFQDLQIEYDVLEDDYIVLDQSYQGLQTDYDTLNANFVSLELAHNNLVDEYNLLVDDYNVLSGEYNWLETIAVVPPYILVANRNITLAFSTTKNEMIYWEIDFEYLEADLQRGNSLRNKIERNRWAYMLELHNSSTGEDYNVLDFRYFVQAGYFTNVSKNLYDDSESDEAFIKEAWNIVTQLASYSDEMEETPRYPLETLLAGGGDCEDTAILLASILDAAPVNWEIELIYMDAYHPTDPQTVNHVIVHVETGRTSHLIETTSGGEMEPYHNGVRGWNYNIHD